MTTIEWVRGADGQKGRTWNPTTGCSRTSPGCDHCLAADTPVLMADMSWRPIGSLVVGDEVVGFTEEPQLGQNRTFERATVLHAWSTTAEAVELTIGNRVVVASEDHRFLCDNRPYWREAARLTLRSSVVDMGAPYLGVDINSAEYLAGYVAGVTGGDGTMRVAGSGRNGTLQSWWRVAVLATDEPILVRLIKAFSVLGLSEIAVRGFNSGSGSFGEYVYDVGERAPMLKVETRRMANLLTLRDEILPERDDLQWRAGFLAGFLDSDGCYGSSNLRFTQTKDNGLLDLTHRCIDRLGFASVREDFRSAKGRSVRLSGDVWEKIRFLSVIQPALIRKATDFYGRRFPSKRLSMVDGVRRVGSRDLVDIQTSTGTFIANGLATHNCYALSMAARLKAMGQPKYQNDGDPRTSGPGFALTLHPDVLEVPLKVRKPTTWFVNSMSDLFHPDVPAEFIGDAFNVMARCPQHTFQILTKRPQRMWRIRAVRESLPNVWLGSSVESDSFCYRANYLRDTPAALRFLSCEPLLGPLPSLDLTDIDWVIVGAESGPGARPMDDDWVRDLRDRTKEAGAAFFFKQRAIHGRKVSLPELDGQVWDEMPVSSQFHLNLD